jgi:hypothetical protein
MVHDDRSGERISVVIWANHLLRAAIRAMQEAAGTICSGPVSRTAPGAST